MDRRAGLLGLVVREAHDQTRSHRFLALTALAGLLAPLIVYVGVKDLATRRGQLELLVQQRASVGGPAGGRLNGRQLEPSLRVIRPPTPSSVLVRGFEGALPAYWDFAPDGVHVGTDAGAASRTPQSGVSLDLEFVIRIVLGLLAVSLGAGSLSSERESGMLYVLMSQPVRPAQVLAAKLAGGAVASSLAMAVVMTSVAAAIAVLEPMVWSRDLQWTLLGLAAVGLLYMFGLYAMGVLIGILASSSSSANIAAIVVWIVVAIASVPTIDLVARVVASVPSAELVESRRQREFDTDLRQTELSIGRWYADHAGPNWRQSDVPDDARDSIWRAWMAAATIRRARMARVDADVAASVSRERQLWTRLAACTAGGVFFDAASRLAGTGLPVVQRWEAAVGARQEFLETALFDRPPNVNIRVPSPVGLALWQVKIGPLVEAETLQQPVEVSSDFRTVAREALAPLGILGGYLVAFVVLAFVSFPKIRY